MPKTSSWSCPRGLREELDYSREAKNMRLYRHMLADEACVRVPEPVDDLTTSRLLTMTWQQGQKFKHFLEVILIRTRAIRSRSNMFRRGMCRFIAMA